MSELLEFIKSHEDAFRSHARLASLYADFRYQRTSNPDGYEANSSAWLRALTAAAKAGLIPTQNAAQQDRLLLHTGESLSRALETREFGRPLALGAAIEDAARKKELIQLKEFLDAKKSVYTQSWIPTPWQVFAWGLKKLGVTGGERVDNKLVAGDFVILANVEAASKTVLERASKVATSNTSRIFSKGLFASTFSDAVGVEALSPTDLSVLLRHLSRDKAAISYSPKGVIKFKAPSESQPSPISDEDISIANLRTLLSSLEPQIQQLTNRISTLTQSAREAVSKNQLTSAKAALRSKKVAEEQLSRCSATLSQLEEIYAKIEQAADQVEIVRVMESSAKTLKSLNAQTGGVERVQDVVDGLREEMTSVEEIGQAINETAADEVDEMEVDEELEALEKVEREKKEQVEREERERREAEEVEATRKKLVELDKVKDEAKTEAVDAAPEPGSEANPTTGKIAETVG